MAEQPAVLARPPRGLALDAHETLVPSDFDRAAGVIRTELDRYPAALRERLPVIVMLRAAHAQGVAVGARYFADAHAVVLTPRLDLRGNLHRGVAAGLIAQHPDRAAALLKRCERNADQLLFRGRLGPDGEATALVAAVKSRRQSLHDLAASRQVIRECLELAVSFLRDVGAYEATDRQQLVEGHLVRSEGSPPSVTLQPAGVDLHLGRPPTRSAHEYTFVSLPEAHLDAVTAGVIRDLWVVPEDLLAETVRCIYVVDDVRAPTCDIAGYAIGAQGGKSDIVIEADRRRAILFHELGHAIHRRYRDRFPLAEWESVAPEADYFGDPHEFIALRISVPDYHASLLDRGFVTSYASSALAEDVAELTEALFGGDPRLWASIETSPKLERKVELMIDFLTRSNSALTREFFQDLATVRHVQEQMWSLR